MREQETVHVMHRQPHALLGSSLKLHGDSGGSGVNRKDTLSRVVLRMEADKEKTHSFRSLGGNDLL